MSNASRKAMRRARVERVLAKAHEAWSTPAAIANAAARHEEREARIAAGKAKAPGGSRGSGGQRASIWAEDGASNA